MGNVIDLSGIIKKDLRYIKLCRLINTNEENEVVLGSLGEDKCITNNFNESPHILIAGQTGSGKSTMLKFVLDGIMFGSNARLMLFDFKGGVELYPYKNVINTYNKEVIYDYEKAIRILEYVNEELDRRFEEMRNNCTNKYNGDRLIIVIDELADLTLSSYSKEATQLLTRIAQMGRGAKINLIICTQKPLVKCIPSLLLANITTRVCLKCASVRESVLILDHKGGELLNGRGDAIVKVNGNETLVEVPYVDDYFQSLYLKMFML